jgi:hypothetical protein
LVTPSTSVAVAELDRVHAVWGAVQEHIAHGHARRRQLRLRPHHHPVAGGVLLQHVQRLGRGHAQAPALADSEVLVTVVAGQHAPLAGHHLAVPGLDPPAHEPAPADAREEAQVLALALVRDRQSGVACEGADRRLGEPPKGERQALELFAPQAGEHVALVLGRVRGHADQQSLAVARDPRIVARGEAGGAERSRQLEHGVEADEAVAAHARVGGAAGLVLGQEVVHHRAAELVAQVEGEVGNAHALGEAPGPDHGLGRAAALLAVRGGVGPQLEGHGHHLVAGVERELRGGGAVHSSAHRHKRPSRARTHFRGTVARGGPQGPVQGVGGQLGGVALGRHEAAEGGGHVIRRHERGAKEWRALDQLDGGAGGRPSGSAARRLEPGLHHPVAFDADRELDQVAAGGAAGCTLMGSARECPLAVGVIEMLGQA